jgi:hypothetical protein
VTLVGVELTFERSVEPVEIVVCVRVAAVVVVSLHDTTSEPVPPDISVRSVAPNTVARGVDAALMLSNTTALDAMVPGRQYRR